MFFNEFHFSFSNNAVPSKGQGKLNVFFNTRRKTSSSKFFLSDTCILFHHKSAQKIRYPFEISTKVVSSQFFEQASKRFQVDVLAFCENALQTCLKEIEIMPLQRCNLSEPNFLRPFSVSFFSK